MPLAPADSLPGMLQRGRGAGFLAALAAPREEACAAVVRCALEDPRRDRQCDPLAGYLADLWVALDLGLDDLAAHLAGPGRDADRDTAGRAVELAVEVLLSLSGRGDARAARALELLRGYVVSGTAWAGVLHRLALHPFGEAARAGATAGLAERISARFPDDEDLRAAMGDSLLWREWFAEGGCLYHPRLLAAWDASDRPAFERPRSDALPAGLPPVLRGLALEPLLAARVTAPERRGEVAEELARRNAAGDREALLRLARGEGDRAVRIGAFLELRDRGIDGALREAEALLDPTEGPLSRYLSRVAGAYITALPAGTSLPWARRWFGAGHEGRARVAGRILARHARPEDLPLLEAKVASVLADPAESCLCDEAEALGRTGRTEARPLLERIHREVHCTLSRNAAAGALAGLPGGLTPDLAVEGLWDCDEDTRELSIRVAPLDGPGVTERLRALAGGDPSLEETKAARARLGSVA